MSPFDCLLSLWIMQHVIWVRCDAQETGGGLPQVEPPTAPLDALNYVLDVSYVILTITSDWCCQGYSGVYVQATSVGIAACGGYASGSYDGTYYYQQVGGTKFIYASIEPAEPNWSDGSVYLVISDIGYSSTGEPECKATYDTVNGVPGTWELRSGDIPNGATWETDSGQFTINGGSGGVMYSLCTAATSNCNTLTPTRSPTSLPSVNPTSSEPSMSPSVSPTTRAPSTSPSLSPTTSEPSVSPSISPSAIPSVSPSVTPSVSPPTSEPSMSPSSNPSTSPSENPSANPSASPSMLPTTSEPSDSPSMQPSNKPTVQPSSSPIRTNCNDFTVNGLPQTDCDPSSSAAVISFWTAVAALLSIWCTLY